MGRYERWVIYFLLFSSLAISLFLYKELIHSDRTFKEIITERIVIQNGDNKVIELGTSKTNAGIIKIIDSHGRVVVSIGADYRAVDYVSAELLLFNYRKDKKITGYYGARGYLSQNGN